MTPDNATASVAHNAPPPGSRAPLPHRGTTGLSAGSLAFSAIVFRVDPRVSLLPLNPAGSPAESEIPMNSHPYLRAFFAGSCAHAASAAHAHRLRRSPLRTADPFPIERGLVFPMALVPSLWALWNILWKFAHTHTPANRPPWRAASLSAVPAGASVATCLGILVLGRRKLLGSTRSACLTRGSPLGSPVLWLLTTWCGNTSSATSTACSESRELRCYALGMKKSCNPAR